MHAKLFALLNNCRKCNRGATAIEYALIIAMIALATVGAISTMASKSINMWQNVANEVNNN